MYKLLTVSGSPVENSSTDFLLNEVSREIERELGKLQRTDIRLNDLKIVPCQACGKVPTDSFCFYEDLEDLYNSLVECDCLLVGSPIYFDSVSAQTKLFIDRCNCIRPPDFNNINPEHDFIKLIKRKRPGGMILVGGEDAWYEGARRTIAGFFKWVEVTNEGQLFFSTKSFNQKNEAADDAEVVNEARQLGQKLAECMRKASPFG